MTTPNQQKIKQTCLRIALLMEHQEILPDLKELAMGVFSQVNEQIDYSSKEYLAGANDALLYLISFLTEKGNR